jgi:maltose alpha-D-glucosyltransferase/alpha-amylase
VTRERASRPRGVVDEPLWYKDAIIYEVHVRAFCDSDGDGIGDFQGLVRKLDYLQDLGITAIWLLPFYPSPLRDDGYDIADYHDVHPNYGTLRDFRLFLREAHKRGLRVITELVVNHTSNEHPWFQRARRSPPGSPHRDFYVWSDTPEKFDGVRIIFQDFETSNWTWDSVAQAYYWHRFYSHQPDLNYDNPRVQKAVLQAVDFWLGMGVDGLRLDAIPYLFQREGTTCENLPETHGFLKKLRKHVDVCYPNRMLLAEANQWPEDAVAYFGDGDECHMAFHFPVMPRMFMAVQLEDRFPLIDILEQTPDIPETSQWALFLRNHDELTLEMVTDEDRDYMYRVYADDPRARVNLGIRRRLAPLLQNRRKIELLNGLLFAFPGTPVVYYADEIGQGDNIYLGDRNGVRTPMQWSGDRNAGFSRANPQKLFLPVIIDPEYHYEACNVETQQKNLHSILWWTKRLIALRKQYKAFGRGDIEFLDPDNRKVLAFLRTYEEERLLVVANLSRFAQYVELDLSRFVGSIPVELFGSTPFPAVGKQPYVLTLGPHSFYYFDLQPTSTPRPARGEQVRRPPVLRLSGPWTTLFGSNSGRAQLEQALPGYLSTRRWFGGKARSIKSASIRELVPMSYNQSTAHLLFVDVVYRHERPETYVLPLACVGGDKAVELERHSADSIMAYVEVDGKSGPAATGVIFDALADRAFCTGLLEAIQRRRRFKGRASSLEAKPTALLKRIVAEASSLEPRVSGAEQSNTSVIFGDGLILKVFRRTVDGTSPDLEIGRFLTAGRRFANAPPVAGALELKRGRGEPITVGLLHGFVPNEGDAWRYTLDEIGQFFYRVLGLETREPPPLTLPTWDNANRIAEPMPPEANDVIGPYLRTADLLAQRTAELHVALSADRESRAFAPERFTQLYQRSLYQSIRTSGANTFDLLKKRMRAIPAAVRDRARAVLTLAPEYRKRSKALLDHAITAKRIRTHGDFHLGQVLYTGADFVIIDFEGEPARSLGERRFKRSPLRDVAGMVRSFHYAAASALEHGSIRGQDLELLTSWARFWYEWVATRFVATYLEHAAGGGFLPPSVTDSALLLDVYLLEKAAYELEYELNNRPGWLHIPLEGLYGLLSPRHAG